MTARAEGARVGRSLPIERTWDGASASPAERVAVTVEWLGPADAAPTSGAGLVLRVDAPNHDDPPPAAPAGPTPRLWEHEVVELFVAGPGGADTVEYLEVELGPHGHHLVLRLCGVRRVVESGLPLDYRVEPLPASPGEAPRWRGEARLPAAWLPPRPWRLNAYAIHGTGPVRRHLAMQPVPGASPDFHQPHRFLPWGDLGTS